MSTTPDDRQRQREQQEAERAKWASLNAEARLKAKGKVGHTAAGRALFVEHAERVTIALGLLLEELVANPHKPGPHFAAWPLLLVVTNRGPRSLAALALGEVINTIGAGQEHDAKKLARAIGKVLQDELRAGRVEKRNADLLRLIRRVKGARALANPKVLLACRCDPAGWTLQDREAVGLLLLHVICGGTDLLTLATVLRRGRPVLVARPTLATMALLASRPPTPLPLRRFPMVVPPRPWEGMYGGGHISSNDPLIRSRQGLDLSYLTPDAIRPVLATVNALQQQELRIDHAMVTLQRQAWDASLPGLFDVSREPEGKEWGNENSRRRLRVEEAIRQCEAVADGPVWFAYCADFRGRIYSSNRYGTHQGPDHEKAVVQFAQGGLVPAEAFDWMLKAAAGHWGVRGTWETRLQWGRDHLQEMVAAAQDPMGRIELWRPAKDPWQFLQLARGISRQIAEPDGVCAVPVRFDQCCSGAGIAAALLRDRKLARLTNLIGSTPHDLYSHVAELVINALRLDLSNGMAHEQRHAETWLAMDIDRSLMKAPVMTSLYGATYLGLVDTLIASRMERSSQRLGRWEQAYVMPSKYMASKLRAILATELAGSHKLADWLRDVSRRVLRHNRPMQWTTPSGMVVRLGAPHDARTNVRTLIRGARKWQTVHDHAEPGELSARATNRALLPNVVHCFDAAFLHGVVCSSVARGVPILTNHDCFATIPRDAHWLHHTLSDHLRAQFMPDWLAIMRDEIADSAGGLALPAPPSVGDLCPAKVGNNRHAFS